jgi:hypothetical protein
LVEGISDAFVAFIDRFGRFFRTRTRDSAAVAGRYLRGLAQADECTFAAMAAVVEESCARKPKGKDALVVRINQRHQRRRGAIESRFRTHQQF